MGTVTTPTSMVGIWEELTDPSLTASTGTPGADTTTGRLQLVMNQNSSHFLCIQFEENRDENQTSSQRTYRCWVWELHPDCSWRQTGEEEEEGRAWVWRGGPDED